VSLLDTVISSLIMAIAINCFIHNFSRYDMSKIRKVIFILLMTLFLILNATVISVYTNSSLKMFINYFALILLLKLVYNENNEESIVNSLILMFLISFYEIIFTALLFIFNIDFETFVDMPFRFVMSTSFVSLAIFLSSKLKFMNKVSAVLRKIVKRNLFALLFLIIVGMDILLFNNFDSNFFSVEYFTNIILLIVFLLIIYLIFKEKFISMKMTEKYDHMEENIKRYEQIINEQNKKSHEFKNQLAVINGYIDEKNAKAKEYIKTILLDANEVDTFFMKEIVKIPSGGLKGLLYYKIYDIKKKNLNFYLKVEGRMVNLSNKLTTIEYKELTQVVGVLIDNAIQAAERSKTKMIDILIKSSRNKYSIRISNAYDKNFDYDKIGESGFTTKGKNRGYGLRLVKDIVEKNDIFKVEKKLNGDMFTQEFEITLNKK